MSIHVTCDVVDDIDKYKYYPTNIIIPPTNPHKMIPVVHKADELLKYNRGLYGAVKEWCEAKDEAEMLLEETFQIETTSSSETIVHNLIVNKLINIIDEYGFRIRFKTSWIKEDY